MFGYITADIRTLSKENIKVYRSYYCGLCNALKQKYGALSRLILSYDTAFLFMLLGSVLTEDEQCCTRRCPYHFGKKCSCVTGDNSQYAADVTVLLTYLKFEDDIADDNSLKAKIMRRLFYKKYLKAKTDNPQLDLFIRQKLSELASLEKAGETDANKPAAVFADILSKVFDIIPQGDRFGWQLGKLIYLMDAVCDFDSDIKHKNYNPLTSYRKTEFYPMLEWAVNDCFESLEKLDIKRHRDIFNNIFESGIWTKYNIKMRVK